MKKTLLLIVLVCTAPIILANALFYLMPPMQGGEQHGELLPEAVPLAEFVVENAYDKTPVSLEALRGKWRLLTVVDINHCDKSCEVELIQMRQLRQALGEDLGRLRNTVVLVAPISAESLEKYQKAFPRFDMLQNADMIVRQTREAFGLEPVGGGVFLVDPHGNLVMRYPQGVGPEGKTEDLRHLFKYSPL